MSDLPSAYSNEESFPEKYFNVKILKFNSKNVNISHKLFRFIDCNLSSIVEFYTVMLFYEW